MVNVSSYWLFGNSLVFRIVNRSEKRSNSSELVGVWICTVPASTCVEISVPECTGWAERAPVHTCQREVCQSPWAHSPHKRNAPWGEQSEEAENRRWRQMKKLLLSVMWSHVTSLQQNTEDLKTMEITEQVGDWMILATSQSYWLWKTLLPIEERKIRVKVRSRFVCKCAYAGRCSSRETQAIWIGAAWY